MAAIETLAQTTLALTVAARDGRIKLTSTANVVPGLFVWFDGELSKVLTVEAQNWVTVQRGQGGSPARMHVGGVTAYIGRGDQFYSTDPVGRPPDQIRVSPHINTMNGSVWFSQGDMEPAGQGDRWWQKQAITRTIGALGVRVTTADPETST